MSLATLMQRKIGLQFEVMPYPTAESLAELLVAFANGDGGTVLLGVTPEGRITGDLLPEDAESALHQALALCKPPVMTEWEQDEDRGGLAVAITVQRGTEMHSLADGRVMRRTNNANQVLIGPQISKLFSTRATGDFELEVVAGAERNDLDDGVIAEYLDRRRQRIGRDPRLTEDELLLGLGAITADGKITVAGMLLFGKHPEFYLPQSGITYVRYAGVERLGTSASTTRYLRREEFNGPLAHILEEAWSVLWQDLRGQAVVRGLVREDHYLLPQEAVREALVNAVCHREYRIRRRVEVSRFDDRLEITSPGSLPAWITIDNILDEHFSRNARLVNVLLEWKYIEQLGLGVDQMFKVMGEAGHPAPKFDETSTSFTVTLRQGSGVSSLPGTVNPQWSHDLNERQIRALQHLSRYERLTIGIYRELCPNHHAETLRLDLVELQDKGMIIKIGDKRGAYYVLKQKTG